jgi:hypothetical protein
MHRTTSNFSWQKVRDRSFQPSWLNIGASSAAISGRAPEAVRCAIAVHGRKAATAAASHGAGAAAKVKQSLKCEVTERSARDGGLLARDVEISSAEHACKAAAA